MRWGRRVQWRSDFCDRERDQRDDESCDGGCRDPGASEGLHIPYGKRTVVQSSKVAGREENIVELRQALAPDGFEFACKPEEPMSPDAVDRQRVDDHLAEEAPWES